jgi:hypothetical protein
MERSGGAAVKSHPIHRAGPTRSPVVPRARHVGPPPGALSGAGGGGPASTSRAVSRSRSRGVCDGAAAVAASAGTLPAMDLRRLGLGEWLVGLGGMALLVSLFLPWYDGGGDELSAWDALAVTDILLALIAAFAVLVWIVTATQRVPALPVALDGLLSLAALFGVLLVLYRVLSVPGEADGRAWALWLGLGGSLAILVGSWLAMADERLSTPDRYTDAAGVPTDPPPPPQRIPAPPAESS